MTSWQDRVREADELAEEAQERIAYPNQRIEWTIAAALVAISRELRAARIAQRPFPIEDQLVPVKGQEEVGDEKEGRKSR